MELTKNALAVLKKRYFKKDANGKSIEDATKMLRRVSKNIAGADKEKEKKYYDIMDKRYFLPNSPTLMNAGNDLQQLSACFVLPIEDSMESIFSAVKNAALIHKSGGGCIIEGSKVFTTFCGIENIEKIYKKMLQRNKEEIFLNDKSKFIDIKDENIKTYSLNKNGYFEIDRITKIWKYRVAQNQIYNLKLQHGIEITTSSWHPFFVLTKDGIVEKTAEEICENDTLILPNNSIRENWIFKENKVIKDIEIDEDLAWFLGYFLGDGSLQKQKNGKFRLRFFDENTETLEKCGRILERLGNKKPKIQKDPRGKCLYITTTNQKILGKILPILGDFIGEKSFKIFIPDFIFKSPLNVIFSFIAGILDSDGTVDKNRPRLSFSSISKEFSEQLVCLLSILGLKPRIRERKARRENESNIFEVIIDGYEILKDLHSSISQFLVTESRKELLKNWAISEPKGEANYIEIPFEIIEETLNEIGINTHNTEIHRQAVNINDKKFWLSRWREGKNISAKKLKGLLGQLNSERTNVLNNIAFHLTKVITIEKIESKANFYDFTVENNNNYLAGKNGFTVIHNTGFTFSKLREKNARVRSTSGVSSGPITFMKVFNSATDAVKQGGTRRGANMAILNVDHPDILDFIKAKQDNAELNNFNISVGVTEEFMNAVQHDDEYELISPHTKKPVKKLKARDVFNLIVDMAHKNGEPGIVFIDRLDRYNPTPEVGKIEATNPCGEQMLLPNEACNLGSINLSLMIKDSEVNWDLLKQTVYDSTDFLDDVIDRSEFPLPEIRKMARANRKIGLGVMGWADMLVQLGIPYNSEKAINLAKEVMEFIDYHSKLESIRLAKERGSFPNFKSSIYSNGKLIRSKTKLDWDKLKQEIAENGIRNATTTTIAPTGTISMIADASSGIEPIFSLAYVKNVMDGEKLIYVNKYFEKVAKEQGFYSKKLMEEISEKGSLQDVKKVPEQVRNVFVTAHDISPEWHIRMQSAFQKYVDNAVSKTINFSYDAKKEDIKTTYELAYQLGCKGVTVYRDGSRDEQVLNIGKKMREQEKSRIAPRRRPATTVGVTKRIDTGCGHLYVTINTDETGICEVFTQMGKVGGCASAQLEAIARLISLTLRSNIKTESIIKQLRGIRCPSPMWSKGKMILSCADGIASALEEFLAKDGNGLKREQKIEKGKGKRIGSLTDSTDSSNSTISTGLGAICPECGAALEFKEGCKTCPICGWSKCS